MIEINKSEECSGCTACMQTCPQKCIEMKKDKEGFLYPYVNKDQCIGCDQCKKVCPVINSTESHPVMESYGAYASDERLRYDSSSGGIFGVIARAVIGSKGMVCAVRMSDDMREAIFDITGDVNDLPLFQGSKYLQAYPMDAYLKIKGFLEKGIQVLFCGTPCQVNALKLYLGRDYSNLLTMDIICHGVPSPSVWRKYADHLEKQAGFRITSVNFRSKHKGWERFGLLVQMEKGKNYYCEMSKDPYMQLFLSNTSIRPACHECRSKVYRTADITVGDFWGIDSVISGLNDRKGISAVIIRTDKGQEWYSNIRAYIKSIAVHYNDIVKGNSSEYSSVHKGEDREEFFSDLNTSDMEALIKKYVKLPPKESFAVRLLRKGKSIIRK